MSSKVSIFVEWVEWDSLCTQSLDLPCLPVVGDVITHEVLQGRGLKVTERRIRQESIVLVCALAWGGGDD
jgi:hypothetical protein